MPRFVRLPPLTEEHGIPANNFQDFNGNHSAVQRPARRQSILISSDPVTDAEPVDCVLVYRHTSDNTNEKNHDNWWSPLERRKRFEEYITKKQHLVLACVTSSSGPTCYVKVHAPFEVLLSTAEKLRMRLPIEKIEDDEKQTKQYGHSCWHRFNKWVKKPFRLDPSLEKEASNYYTAVYSSKIDKFKDLFDTLHGSKETYFTPSERSLLTHELLARAHVDDTYDYDQQEPVMKRTPLTAIGSLRTGSSRPGIHRLIAKKAYDSYFPLHESLRDDVTKIDDTDLNDREKLQKYWATMRQWLKFQPFSLIRSYMGEKVAFYFAFLGFYNLMLIPAALVGLIIFIYGVGSVSSDQPTSDICGDFGQKTYMCPLCDKICPFWTLNDSCVDSKISYVFDNVATVIFGILMSLWTRWFIEFWKRREAVLQYEWDSIEFEAHLQPIRPAFENQVSNNGGQLRPNPVTGDEEPFVPTSKRVPYYLIGVLVVIVTLAIICATVFGTIVYRVQMTYILKQTSAKTYSSIIITVTSAVMNLICSMLLQHLYYWLARKITDFELHKYQSTYDDSLIVKIYVFQFVNFYSSLFYIAFFKGRFNQYPSTYGETGSTDFSEQCDPAGCFFELSIQLIIIMVGKQLINNLIQLIAASRRSCACSCCCCCKDANHIGKPQWEIDNDLIDFDSSTLLDEYLDLVIQFGFVTLFVVAFPLAPLFALLNNLIELRLDAWKFLSKYKRPIPYKASDIGIWSDIISAISYLAVLTNAISIAWTSEFIPKMAYRSLQSTGTSLNGYVNWTLSSFPITDYNATGMMPPGVPDGLVYCRYQDFRESTGPNYSHTSIYWNVLAARLAFIVVFEHMIFFIIYIMQWLIPDVPEKIQDQIDHQRFIDQRERWARLATDHDLNIAVTTTQAMSKFAHHPNGRINTPVKVKEKSATRQPNRRAHINVRISPEDKQ